MQFHSNPNHNGNNKVTKLNNIVEFSYFWSNNPDLSVSASYLINHLFSLFYSALNSFSILYTPYLRVLTATNKYTNCSKTKYDGKRVYYKPSLC